MGNEKERKLQYLELRDPLRGNIGGFQVEGIHYLEKTTRFLSLTKTYDRGHPKCEPNQHTCVPGTLGR